LSKNSGIEDFISRKNKEFEDLCALHSSNANKSFAVLISKNQDNFYRDFVKLIYLVFVVLVPIAWLRLVIR